MLWIRKPLSGVAYRNRRNAYYLLWFTIWSTTTYSVNRIIKLPDSHMEAGDNAALGVPRSYQTVFHKIAYSPKSRFLPGRIEGEPQQDLHGHRRCKSKPPATAFPSNRKRCSGLELAMPVADCLHAARGTPDRVKATVGGGTGQSRSQ
jgi:hypothetical protein